MISTALYNVLKGVFGSPENANEFLSEFGDGQWRSPVANFASLPVSDNDEGDARVTLDTSFVYIWDGASWVHSGLTSGINSLNSLAVVDQTLAVGSAGTDFAIVSAVDTHTFNLPSASATARGVVTTGAQHLAGAKTFDAGSFASPSVNLSTLSGFYASADILADATNLQGLGIKFTATDGLKITIDSGYDTHGIGFFTPGKAFAFYEQNDWNSPLLTLTHAGAGAGAYVYGDVFIQGAIGVDAFDGKILSVPDAHLAAISFAYADGDTPPVLAAGTVKVKTGTPLTLDADKVLVTAGLGVGNSAAATTPGAVVRKIEIFDAAGASLGFIAVYDAIT